MGGSILIAARACLKTGAGLTACLTDRHHITAGLVASPEVMFAEWTAENVQQRLEWCDVIAFGPGVGMSAYAEQLAMHVNQIDKPKVVDAGGLAILAKQPTADEKRIITPHPGEAAVLLGITVSQVESDRYLAVKSLQARYGGVVVLKGAGTLVCNGLATYVCSAGNAGMASGGMGDALSGILVALLAQGLDCTMAARVGVMLHSRSADINAEQYGQCGLQATDVIDSLRKTIHLSRSLP